MKILYRIIPVIALLAALASPVNAQETDGELLRERPSSSVTEALSGLFPWLVSDSGLTLRQAFSASGCSPLILVDGVEMSTDLLDPSVVESVSILREGEAAAIYGARAAAGAILIKTRNSDGLDGSGTTVRAGAGLYGESGLAQAYSVMTRGGDESFNYAFSGNYYGNQGEGADCSGVGSDRFGFGANTNARISRHLHYSLGVKYAHNGESSALSASSYGLDDSRFTLLSNRLTAGLGENLKFNLCYSFSNAYGLRRGRTVESDGLPDTYEEFHRNRSENDINANASYTGIFSDGSRLYAIAGADIQSGSCRDVRSAVGNLLDPNYSVLTIGDGDFDVDDAVQQYFQCGFFAQATYEWLGRYKARLTVREDGTSRLPSANRWNTSAGASFEWKPRGWLTLRYSFSAVANHSLEQSFAYYASVDNTAGASPYLFERSGLGQYSRFNYPVSDDLKAEKVISNDLCCNAALLNSRLVVDVCAYTRSVKDMLNPYAAVSATFGATAPLMNQGSAFGFGADVSAKWTDRAGELDYSVCAMLSAHRTNVTLPLPLPGLACCLRAGLGWRSLSLDASLDAMDDPGFLRLGHLSLGYDFKIRNIPPMRLALCARNVCLSGEALPKWILAQISMSF